MMENLNNTNILQNNLLLKGNAWLDPVGAPSEVAQLRDEVGSLRRGPYETN